MNITEEDYPLVAEYKDDEMHVSIKRKIKKVFIYQGNQVFQFTLPHIQDTNNK